MIRLCIFVEFIQPWARSVYNADGLEVGLTCPPPGGRGTFRSYISVVNLSEKKRIALDDYARLLTLLILSCSKTTQCEDLEVSFLHPSSSGVSIHLMQYPSTPALTPGNHSDNKLQQPAKGMEKSAYYMDTSLRSKEFSSVGG